MLAIGGGLEKILEYSQLKNVGATFGRPLDLL